MQNVNSAQAVITVNTAASPTPTPGPQVSQVTFGSTIGQAVTMSSATAGATIFYTTDNTNPTHNGTTATGTTHRYTGPVTVGKCSEEFFKASAYKSGMTDAVITSYDADYTGLPTCN